MKRRGTVYLLVLVTAGVTVALGMLAVFASAAQREMQELSIQRERAAFRAESAIHLALNRMDGLSSWRSLPSGRVFGSLTMDRGEMWVFASDEDGSLTDDAADPFTLTATATFGEAKQRVAADFQIKNEPIEALHYPIVAQRGLLNNHELSLQLPGASVLVDVDKTDPLSPWPSARSMADIDVPAPSMISDYARLGVLVPVIASKDGKAVQYEELVLTSDAAQSREAAGLPASPDGVYVIDGQGLDIEITQATIVGTLVVVNAASVRIHDPKVLRPRHTGWPVLLIESFASLDGLEESKTDETYPDNDDREPTDFDDSVFDGVQGLIYVNGDAEIKGSMDLHGTLVATGTIDVASNIAITVNEAFLESPPPGWRSGNVELSAVPGSWRQVVD